MSINWTGAWVSTTAYNIGDAVSYLGSSYVAATANTGVNPPTTPASSSTWNLLAAAGSVTLSSVPTSFIWLGVYSALTAYYTYDCVSYNGSSYICLANGVLNQEPDVSPFFWGVLADGGSGTSWGEIGGTLANQTDLESVLTGKQGTLTLTTSGTSGPATLTNGTLNIPIFAGGGSMTWPVAAGVAVYAGFSAWGTSLAAPASALVGVSDTQTLTNKTVNGVTPTTMSYLDATSSIQTQLNGMDASGAAATAQANAETFSANASNITSGTVAAARLPAALSSSTSVNGTAIPASATLLTTAVAASTYAPIITLTTTGSSGAATYSGNTLNIPQYAGGGMVYPASGVSVSTGAAWGTSLTAPAGAIVGTTDTQTLTNKTIDGVTPTTMGYVDATSSIQTQLNAKQASLTLTTTGSSGAATLSGGTLNIPQYAGGGSMTYPSGSGVAVVASGTSWGTTLVVNGAGAGVVTGPSTVVTGRIATFTGTTGQIQDSGTLLTALAPLASPTFTGTVAGITATMVGLSAVTNDAQTKAAVVPNTAPSAGQALVGNAGGTAYAPVTMSGDATLASTGAITVTKSGGVAFGSAAFVASSTFQAALTLTTTGTSGAATLSSGTLNIPQYAGGGSMTWPGAAGIAVYAGSSAWGTSLTAPAGTIVGTTDTQTLTNKTIDGVTPTTMGYVDATSSIQTQLNGKQATINFVDSEVVSGSGTTFTLAHTPVSGSLHLFNATARLWPGASPKDYTISGATITMNYSLATGALLADYRY